MTSFSKTGLFVQTLIRKHIIPFIAITMTLFFGCGQESEELAVIETEFGRIVIRFFAEEAPKHVESFKILAKDGYFDGTTFHRVVPGFVIQGGDPNSKDDDRSNDGNGGRAGKFYGVWDVKVTDTWKSAQSNPDSWLLPAEFNELTHKRGAVSMARSQDPNSASSQFFICVENAFRLDRKYSIFGEVVEGLDVADKIVNLDTPKKLNPKYMGNDADNPNNPVKMKVWLTTAKELNITLPE